VVGAATVGVAMAAAGRHILAQGISLALGGPAVLMLEPREWATLALAPRMCVD
jgi:hypothetical protein